MVDHGRMVASALRSMADASSTFLGTFPEHRPGGPRRTMTSLRLKTFLRAREQLLDSNVLEQAAGTQASLACLSG